MPFLLFPKKGEHFITICLLIKCWSCASMSCKWCLLKHLLNNGTKIFYLFFFCKKLTNIYNCLAFLQVFALCTVRWRRVKSEAIHCTCNNNTIAKLVPRVDVFSEHKCLIICLRNPYLSQRFIFRESMNRQFILNIWSHSHIDSHQRYTDSHKDGDSVQRANTSGNYRIFEGKRCCEMTLTNNYALKFM